MVKRVKVKMQSDGSRALLQSPEVQELLAEKLGLIASAAGPGFVPDVSVGRTRALGFVAAETPEAFAAEANDRALTRALDAAR